MESGNPATPDVPVLTATPERGGESLGAIDLLLLALWLGALGGICEVAILGVIKLFSLASAPVGWVDTAERLRHDYLWLSPHVVWMASVMFAVFLTVPAILLAILGRLKRAAISTPTAVGVLAFICFASLLFVYPRLHDVAVVLLAGGLAAQLARIVARRQEGFWRLVRGSRKWLLTGVVLAAVGMNVAGALREKLRIGGLPAISSESPNVLLLILDTVRASNLSVYGYPRKTTPHLEQLAAHGVVFDRATATSPWTLPSHVSLFTGRVPYEFSVNFLYPYEGEYTTLAEYLSARGYMTAGFVGNLVYCGYESGIARGFLHYEDYRISPSEFLVSTALGRRIAGSGALHRLLGHYDVFGEKDAADVTDEFLHWVDRRPRNRPFFAFLNFMDAHEPYLPPQRFEEQFGSTQVRRNDLNRYFLRWATRPGRESMTPEEIGAELGAYDGTIAYLDEQIGGLLEELEAQGLLHNTLVIVTADHGEQFGEHDLHVHGNSLYMPVLHVPLIMAFADHVPEGRRITGTASIKDIPATVMSLIGLRDENPFPGVSLEQYWSDDVGGQELLTEPILSELTDIRGAPTMKSLLVGRYHYIWGENGFEALFDIESDPHELQSLMTRENLGLVTRMRRALAPHIRNDRDLWERLPERGRQPAPRPIGQN